MRRTLAAAGATLVAMALATSLARLDGAAAAQPSQARAALRYLYSQQAADGSVGGAPGATEDTVIGTADNGFDPATLRTPAGVSAFDYLKAQTLAGKSDGTAGATAKLILALVAGGQDPTNFAGVNLVARLNSSPAGGGFLQSNGAFHASDPAVETANTFSQAFAVLADVAAGRKLPLHAAGWLVCAQRNGTGGDHGFGYAITATASSPPALCGDTVSDSNDTAIALQALNAAGDTAANATARTYLAGIQHADGGFPAYDAGPGSPPVASDPDSDAIVIEALAAMRLDPTTFTNGGNNPVANLDSFQDARSGGFTEPGKPGPDAFTTSEVPAALAIAPYAAVTRFLAGATPIVATAPAAGPTPTAAPTSGPPLGASITTPATGGEVPLSGAAALLLAGAGLLLLFSGRSRRGRSAG